MVEKNVFYVLPQLRMELNYDRENVPHLIPFHQPHRGDMFVIESTTVISTSSVGAACL